MKKIIALLLFFGSIAFAQTESKEISRLYLDDKFLETTQGNHVFYRIVLEDEDRSFTSRTFYASGKLYSQGHCLYDDGTVYNGTVREFWENGGTKEKTQWEKGHQVGSVQRWYEDGKPRLVGHIKDNTDGPTRSAILMIDQFWNSKGEQTVTEGKGIYADDYQDIAESGEIANGFRVGKWIGKDAKLALEFEETYAADGNLVSGTSKDAEGNVYNYIRHEEKPEFPGGIKGFYEFVKNTFRTPENSPSGRFITSFLITADGFVKDLKVHNAKSASIANAIFDMMSRCPKWAAGKTRGKSVEVRFTLPIVISGG